MRKSSVIKSLALFISFSAPLLAFHPAFAATPDGAAQINNFLKNMINIAAGLGGTIATGALVYGGIMYMISAGDLKKLDRSKAIIKYAAIGLVLVIAAAAIVNLVSSQALSAFGG